MHIDSIYYFDYTKEIGFYDSIRDFRLEEMTYIGLALSTPKIRINATPTKYTIEETVSNKIREHTISQLDRLKEVSQTLAENSPKYILICYSDDTKHYFAYDEEFCGIFKIAKEHKPKENQEDTYDSPFAIQKNESLTSNSYVGISQSAVYTNTNTPSKTYAPKEEPSHSILSKKDKPFPWGMLILGLIAVVLIIGLIGNIEDDADTDLTPVSEPYSGTILSGSEIYNESEITIKASGGEACVVKLKNRYGIERLSFYVQAGDTVTVGVPAEYLYVYFASGDIWYGKDLLFGENTSYQMVRDIKDFREYTWEYTLYPVSDGNLSLSPINDDEF